MKKARIRKEACDGSPFCPARRACPQGAIVPSGPVYRVVPEKCTGCGACVPRCPMRAVSMA